MTNSKSAIKRVAKEPSLVARHVRCPGRAVPADRVPALPALPGAIEEDVSDGAALLPARAQSAFSALMIKARKTAGLTQHELARRLDKPQSFIAKYEGGERRIDVVEFVTICRAIGANPVKLLKALLKV